jgi:hypothetical protein
MFQPREGGDESCAPSGGMLDGDVGREGDAGLHPVSPDVVRFQLVAEAGNRPDLRDLLAARRRDVSAQPARLRWIGQDRSTGSASRPHVTVKSRIGLGRGR